jgi:subtilisin
LLAELPDADAKLIELDAPAVAEARAAVPGQRLVRERDYRPAVAEAPQLAPPPDATAAPVRVDVRCAASGEPLAGAHVTAALAADPLTGASAVSDRDGIAELRLGGSPVELAELGVRPPAAGSWGVHATAVRVRRTHSVRLPPVDLGAEPLDVLRHFYGRSPSGGDGAGVRVGVIDTGIDADHPALVVADGVNTVVGEADELHGDNGHGHGTHVAGIIAARGRPPSGVRGLAPEAELCSLRVYAQGARTAGGFAILAALLRACDLGCDLVNLSLEATQLDEALEDAVSHALDHGVVAIAAAGNGSRRPVAVPARYACAVTALGRRGTFPAGSLEEGQVADPCGTSADDFLAGFSNVGREVDLTAPGVGVVSTVPGGHGPDQGTSMAAAAATGMAARLLSVAPEVMGMPRDRARATAILDLLARNAAPMGLGFRHEGYGMLA